MVRVYLKGGVWKNSEDEVLKAAVQKYGKQQWARVASLLNRKTAKQAKARWYEWLDPAIRKTEWSRQEEEKLLHLAKLLPAQWRTIGPLVGRTATQCQEHYERLLDRAAAEAATAAGGTAGTSDVDELRQQAAALRPGQIDAHPETRPAKPDPIDMDEDELEMLQEARARLANTMGKKAKRKQREKMLAQAKRLADLQKRRELKAAGLLSQAALKRSKQSKREIDLGVEIPFFKPAPAGFHDVSQEQAKTNAIRETRWKQVDLHQVNENRFRTRDLEEAQQKKREERRLRVLNQVNESYAKEKAALEEAAMARPARGALQLPEPTLTDSELSELAKQQSHERLRAGSAATASLGGTDVTLALIGDYTDRPLPTPMRTPLATSGASVAGTTRTGAASLKPPPSSTRRDLLQEAHQLRRLERGQTPLLAAMSSADNGNDLDDDDDDAEDRADGGGTRATGYSVAGASAPDDAASVGASTWASTAATPSLRELARQQRRQAKKARRDLEAALAALPAPQYEYELAAPTTAAANDNDEMEGVVSTVTDDDQADVEAAQRAALKQQADAKREALSTVLKRTDLPRPLPHPQQSRTVESAVAVDPAIAAAQGLVHEEMLALLQHDARSHPVASNDGSGKKSRKRKATEAVFMEEATVLVPETPLQVIPAHALEAARQAVDEELDALMTEQVTAVLESERVSDPEAALQLLSHEAIQASRKGARDLVFTENGWVTADSDEVVLASLRMEFEELQKATEALRKRNDKLESKLKVVNGGYAKLADKCSEGILQAFAATQNARIEQAVYRMLQAHEQRGGAERVDRLLGDVQRLQSVEAALQQSYGELVVERRRRMVLESANAAPS